MLPVTTSAQVRDLAPDVAVLPVGSFEQHGSHLPLITDTAVAAIITKAIADVYPVLHLPPITISCSHEHDGFPGTVSISAATLYALVTDIAASVRKSGIRHLVLINGHGGNYVLSNVVQESDHMALFPTEADWTAARLAGGVVLTNEADMHAGEFETSLLLHAHPELVADDYAEHDHVTGDRPHMLTVGLKAYTTSGVVGRPSLASAEKGRAALAHLVTSFADVLSALKSSS
jgi:creatinine amidohydrolase